MKQDLKPQLSIQTHFNRLFVVDQSKVMSWKTLDHVRWEKKKNGGGGTKQKHTLMATTNMFYSHEWISHRDKTGGHKQLQGFPGHLQATCLPLAQFLPFHGLLPLELNLPKYFSMLQLDKPKNKQSCVAETTRKQVEQKGSHSQEA